MQMVALGTTLAMVFVSLVVRIRLVITITEIAPQDHAQQTATVRFCQEQPVSVASAGCVLRSQLKELAHLIDACGRARNARRRLASATMKAGKRTL